MSHLWYLYTLSAQFKLLRTKNINPKNRYLKNRRSYYQGSEDVSFSTVFERNHQRVIVRGRLVLQSRMWTCSNQVFFQRSRCSPGASAVTIWSNAPWYSNVCNTLVRCTQVHYRSIIRLPMNSLNPPLKESENPQPHVTTFRTTNNGSMELM